MNLKLGVLCVAVYLASFAVKKRYHNGVRTKVYNRQKPPKTAKMGYKKCIMNLRVFILNSNKLWVSKVVKVGTPY